MTDPITTVGTGAGATLFGGILVWLGIRKSVERDLNIANKEIDKVDQRVDKMILDVQTKNTCAALHSGIDKEFKNVGTQFTHVNEKIDNIHADVKTILGKIK